MEKGKNKEFETDYAKPTHPDIFGLLDFPSGYWILQPGSPAGYWPKKLISTPAPLQLLLVKWTERLSLVFDLPFKSSSMYKQAMTDR